MAKKLEDVKSNIVKDSINDLMEFDEKTISLLVLIDTDEGMAVKFGADGATRQNLFAMIGTIEQVKLRILDMLNRDDDDDEGEGENEADDGDDVNDTKPTGFGYH